ncbi:MAG: ABC transporter permease subunit [Halobacteriales archaeon]
MSWRDVFRRDLRSVFRSRLGFSVAIVLVVLTAGVGALINYTSNSEYPPEMAQMVVVFGSIVSLLVPVVALLASYSAIVGERTTGSVRFLLGLPNSRTDAFVGKFLSRTLTVVAPLLVGLGLASLLVVPVAESGSYRPMVLLAGLSAWYAVIFVGGGLAASTLADTDTRAVALVVGGFAILRAGWPALQWAGLQSLQEPRPYPEWYFWFGRINPINAFVRATMGLVETGSHPLLTIPRDVARSPRNPRFELPREPVTDSFALSLELALIVLAVATVVFPLAGYLHFRRRDVM